MLCCLKIQSIDYQIIQLKKSFLDDSVTLEKRLDAIKTLKKEIKFDGNDDFFSFSSNFKSSSGLWKILCCLRLVSKKAPE